MVVQNYTELISSHVRDVSDICKNVAMHEKIKWMQHFCNRWQHLL